MRAGRLHTLHSTAVLPVILFQSKIIEETFLHDVVHMVAFPENLPATDIQLRWTRKFGHPGLEIIYGGEVREYVTETGLASSSFITD